MDDIFDDSYGPTNNYYIACEVLRNLFYIMDFTEEEFKNNRETGQSILFLSLKFALEHGVMIPREYIKLPVTYISNEDETKFGYIIEFPDAVSECDCRFVGMMYENGVRKYYTAEYYEFTKRFGFCTFSEEGNHASYADTITSFDDFKTAILK